MFTAPGVDHEHQATNTATFVFSNGTISLSTPRARARSTSTRRPACSPINEHGTYTLTGGTGAYAGITGNGTYKLSILAIGARSGGKCSQSMPPVALHQVINASGPVSLP